jgi:hypothetical protein
VTKAADRCFFDPIHKHVCTDDIDHDVVPTGLSWWLPLVGE